MNRLGVKTGRAGGANEHCYAEANKTHVHANKLEKARLLSTLTAQPRHSVVKSPGRCKARSDIGDINAAGSLRLASNSVRWLRAAGPKTLHVLDTALGRKVLRHRLALFLDDLRQSLRICGHTSIHRQYGLGR